MTKRERGAQGPWRCEACYLEARMRAESEELRLEARRLMAPMRVQSLRDPESITVHPPNAPPIVLVAGKWPGEETDAELLEQLQRFDREDAPAPASAPREPLPSSPELSPAERGIASPGACQTPATHEVFAELRPLWTALQDAAVRHHNGSLTLEALAREARRIAHDLDGIARRALYACQQESASLPAAPSEPPRVPPTDAAASPEAASQAQPIPAGDADDLPPGWREGDGAMLLYGESAVRAAAVWMYQGQWHWLPPSERKQQAYPPCSTMLEAMCAALGIELRQGAETGRWYAGMGAVVLVNHDSACMSVDAGARLALERYHAQQQALKAQPGTPVTAHPRPAGEVRDPGAHAGGVSPAPGTSEATGHPCRCWQANGQRIVYRACSLHAAEWHERHGEFYAQHDGCDACQRAQESAEGEG